MSNPSFRTFFITRDIPYPPMNGGLLRNWQNINIMMKFGPVGVFSCFDSKQNPSDSLPGVSLWHPCQITKPSSFWETLKRWAWRVRPAGDLYVYKLYSQSAADELQEVIQKFQPDLVVFAEIWMYRYLPVVQKYGLPIIFDNHNVEALTKKISANQSLISQIKEKLQFFQHKNIEREFIRQAKQVWVCSEEDSYLLQEVYGQKSYIRVVPNGLNLANYDSVRLGECSPPSGLEDKHRNFIFMGNFAYPPNREAAELLIQKIYPELRQSYPNCRLLLVGQNPNQFMREAAKKDAGIIVTGRVPDILPYLAAASVAVVPLLQGGGTRLKILEAFAAGCPVVSTAKGAEGLKAKDGEHLLIRDKMEEIVEGVSQIWAEPFLGEKIANSAYELVREEYSWEAVSRRVESAMSEFLSEFTQ
ncbi:glycosyltransferase family 4 protein [Argonema galeatum]|uniref:glycosyltransferase family 4 protein n=1 Tax=Argonema galeatum TaxID=2942762 RepID=UPI0020132BA6|nr:glycosyltransferase family 4 protein [Argonema galeatum]MCL1463492.1 glycosyltransferase family 4 protein [Argonema galeatum A003/A1]